MQTSSHATRYMHTTCKRARAKGLDVVLFFTPELASAGGGDMSRQVVVSVTSLVNQTVVHMEDTIVRHKWYSQREPAFLPASAAARWRWYCTSACGEYLLRRLMPVHPMCVAVHAAGVCVLCMRTAQRLVSVGQ
ncbi:hypothetical protein HaLaN_23479, partial [Haematococcus lacustris]